VDLAEGVLTIRGAKFGKDRLLPLHASTCKVLADYIVRRDRHWAGRDVSPYLFVSSWGGRLDPADVHRTFYALSRKIGLRGASDSHGPRLHDMRHAFCDKNAGTLVPIRTGSRAPPADSVGLPWSCSCRRYTMVPQRLAGTHVRIDAPT
jgi:integrase